MKGKREFPENVTGAGDVLSHLCNLILFVLVITVVGCIVCLHSLKDFLRFGQNQLYLINIRLG